MTDFAQGDRVRVVTRIAPNFVQPVRKWVQEERSATVESVDRMTGRIVVVFDCARKPKDPSAYRVSGLKAHELERVQ